MEIKYQVSLIIQIIYGFMNTHLSSLYKTRPRALLFRTILSISIVNFCRCCLLLSILQWISLFKGPSFCNMLKSKTGLREAGKGYIPECEGDNGTFSPVQCSQDQESCWCVFENGEEVPGTRVSGGRPVCASEFLLEACCFWASPGLELDPDPNFFQHWVAFKLLCSDLYRDFCSRGMVIFVL